MGDIDGLALALGRLVLGEALGLEKGLVLGEELGLAKGDGDGDSVEKNDGKKVVGEKVVVGDRVIGEELGSKDEEFEGSRLVEGGLDGISVSVGLSVVILLGIELKEGSSLGIELKEGSSLGKELTEGLSLGIELKDGLLLGKELTDGS